MGWLLTAVLWPAAVSCFALVACSSAAAPSARDTADANDTGRVLSASSATERALLSEVATLPSGAEQPLGSGSVVADAPYAAASGRTCRALYIKQSQARSSSRLACTDGKTWFFVPDVFRTVGE